MKCRAEHTLALNIQEVQVSCSFTREPGLYEIILTAYIHVGVCVEEGQNSCLCFRALSMSELVFTVGKQHLGQG